MGNISASFQSKSAQVEKARKQNQEKSLGRASHYLLTVNTPSMKFIPYLWFDSSDCTTNWVNPLSLVRILGPHNKLDKQRQHWNHFFESSSLRPDTKNHKTSTILMSMLSKLT
ncbi:hypothetical protein EYC80_004317 [Monilinia laxa]|uniref:Uncharacterized protein n=1 Tax=Monilinia laxa TaxID=61186 RepID=A0A5N6KMW5_MONLA|nr:hypothetical protein EYC80_004317 [Monilinia laxa]